MNTKSPPPTRVPLPAGDVLSTEPLRRSELDARSELQEARVAVEDLIRHVEHRIARNQLVARGPALVELHDVDVAGNILRMVERVDQLDGQLQLRTFREMERLLYLEVPVVDRTAGECLPPTCCQSAEPGSNVLRVGVLGDVGDDRGAGRTHRGTRGIDWIHIRPDIREAFGINDRPVTRGIAVQVRVHTALHRHKLRRFVSVCATEDVTAQGVTGEAIRALA